MSGYKNGRTGWLDDPYLERLIYNSKRVVDRSKGMPEWWFHVTSAGTLE